MRSAPNKILAYQLIAKHEKNYGSALQTLNSLTWGLELLDEGKEASLKPWLDGLNKNPDYPIRICITTTRMGVASLTADGLRQSLDEFSKIIEEKKKLKLRTLI